MDIDWWSLIMQGVGAAVDTYVKAFQMNPWPWLAIGGLALGLLLLPATRRRRRRY
ncbi:hypothetical protein [Homoserinibacter sp. GY 40078]|uniref:hypothetical protein n=1 Tax=Homoserinibacter sp. GY 40078 TaxID=2603275 RepID=UPI0016500813|nr:hypothetical protein [Homoserinibacter sp. GY 40078]